MRAEPGSGGGAAAGVAQLRGRGRAGSECAVSQAFAAGQRAARRSVELQAWCVGRTAPTGQVIMAFYVSLAVSPGAQ